MRKLMYLFPLALGLFVFSSCSKCKDCSCTQTISQTGVGDFTQSVEFTDVCDEDLDAIEVQRPLPKVFQVLSKLSFNPANVNNKLLFFL